MISNLVSDLLDLPYCMKWSRLNFGCVALDKCTRGIVTRGITEICGVSGSGKTQLLLQLSLMTQLTPEFGGLGGSVAYICTEHVFPSKRLFEISQIFAKKYPSLDINYLANVHVEHIHNSVSFLKSEFCLICITPLHFALSVDFLVQEQLLKCCSERLPPLMSSEHVRLIVIDSVAAVFRTYSDFVQRARDMRKLANCLLSLADRHNCAVVCVNQVRKL